MKPSKSMTTPAGDERGEALRALVRLLARQSAAEHLKILRRQTEGA